MMMAERQLKILNMIQDSGSVQVKDLAKALDVSPMTIRRDLLKLQKEGLIERCHGGAVSKTETNYAEKSVKNHAQKILKRQLVKQCRRSFLVADASKFNRQGMNRINSLADYSGIITDYVFRDSEKSLLRKTGARVISVKAGGEAADE